MNAKKIMGAVLVALLAAALFVGAGAAASGTDLGLLYTYTNVDVTDQIPGIQPGDAFVADNGQTISASALTGIASGAVGFALSESQFVPNMYYSNGVVKFKLAAPSVAITATVNGESIIGDSAEPTDTISWGIAVDKKIASTISTSQLVWITPAGAEVSTMGAQPYAVGEWGVKVNLTGYIAKGGPKESPVVYFTIEDASAKDSTFVLEKETVVNGTSVAVKYDTADASFSVTYDSAFLEVVENQINVGTPQPVTGTLEKVTISQKEGTLVFTAIKDGSSDITADFTDDDITVTVTSEKGKITVAAEQASYFIGTNIELSGTNTAADALTIYIAGTNFKLNDIATANTKSDDTWEATIEADDILDATGKKPDAGTYTIYVATDAGATAVSQLTTYGTVSVALKQPFISITEAPAVVVQETEAVFKGTAESADFVQYYIFGTNFFTASSTNVKNSEFSIKLTKDDTDEEKMATGQYFVVVQHPMYDERFNIKADGKNIQYAATLSNGQLDNFKTLFNVDERQTANAAQALCDALDTQDIDDMYVKLSFVVAAQSSTINPIPSEITKGSKLTVSGTTNAGEGVVVTVDMISAAFAAVPKDTVGSASFISLITTTDKDGNWEVTFDTTGLNVDEYIVTAAVADLNKATAKVNVIEGAPTENPTEQPTQTEQPTEQPTETEAPTTPGFGALAALAGLGAVAVLLLRRE